MYKHEVREEKRDEREERVLNRY